MKLHRKVKPSVEHRESLVERIEHHAPTSCAGWRGGEAASVTARTYNATRRVDPRAGERLPGDAWLARSAGA